MEKNEKIIPMCTQSGFSFISEEKPIPKEIVDFMEDRLLNKKSNFIDPRNHSFSLRGNFLEVPIE